MFRTTDDRLDACKNPLRSCYVCALAAYQAFPRSHWKIIVALVAEQEGKRGRSEFKEEPFYKEITQERRGGMMQDNDFHLWRKDGTSYVKMIILVAISCTSLIYTGKLEVDDPVIVSL